MHANDEHERQGFDALAGFVSQGVGLRLLRTIEMLAAAYRLVPTPQARPPARRAVPATLPSASALRKELAGSSRRLVLLGESAAAGYLLAPELTPALAIKSTLSRHSKTPWDVVDLAEVDLSASGLVEAARRAAALCPDVVVVFAGNNWPVRLRLAPPAGHLLPIEQALAYRSDGVGGLRRLAEAATRRLSEATLRAALRVVRESGALPLVVVPEVDLHRWGRARPVTWLPADGVRRWHAAQQVAVAALHTGDPAGALAAADAMLELDGGHCPTTHRLRSSALHRLGRIEEARGAARAEVDARAFDNDPTVPGATSGVQEAIREVAHLEGVPIVDLPALFEADGVGGERHFLDYCHLAPRGIALLAAAVTRAVLAKPGAAQVEATGHEVCTLPPERLARALLLAGLYAAHWSEPAGGEEDHALELLTEALGLDPALGGAVSDWVQTRVVPREATLFSSAMQRLGEGLLAGLDPLWNVPGLDPDGLDRLERLTPELARQITGGLLGSDHDASRGTVDLLDPTYLWNSPSERAARRFFGAGAHAFRRVAWPNADFALVADALREVELDLTLRVESDDAHGATVHLFLNAESVASVRAGRAWTRHRLILPRVALRAGLNRLRLSFPSPGVSGDLALERIARSLDLGHEADLHPRFGDIFRLEARPSGGVEAGGTRA